MTMSVLRPAARQDISGMHRVRLAVRENRLTTTMISEADYLPAIETTGRGWVVERGGEIIAFTIGNRETGSIWALFVDPRHEGQGYGKRLHGSVVTWLWSQGWDHLWLTTEPGTRAQGFYESLGWEHAGYNKHGEIRFELSRPASSVS